MKFAVKLYRLFKPVCIYTSYLFTSLTLLCLAVHELTGRKIPFSMGFLWALFFFSLGSICLQRVFLGSDLLGKVSYVIRLALYACGTVLWGYGCLRVFAVLYEMETAVRAALIPVLALGMLCCVGLELFNRYRAHMYNSLLEQYKKRKNG